MNCTRSLFALCILGSLFFSFPVDAYDLDERLGCTSDAYMTTCPGKLGSVRDELFSLLEGFLQKKYGKLSSSERQKKYQEVLERLDTILPVLAESTFVCPTASTCTPISDKQLLIYAVYQFIGEYLRDHTVQTIEENEGYTLTRYDALFFIEPTGTTEWVFDFLGTTATTRRNKDRQSCAVINAGYFGTQKTDETTRYQPAGDIRFIHPTLDREVDIRSINSSFADDRNLQVQINYDTTTNFVTLGSGKNDLTYYAGPYIIREGELNQDTTNSVSHYQQLKPRTFLVIDTHGKQWWGFSPLPMSLVTLGKKLQKVPFLRGKYSVVNLDGGSSTSFVSETMAFNASKRLPWYVGLCPEERQTTSPRMKFMNEVEGAVNAYMYQMQQTPDDDRVLGGWTISDVTLASPSTWLPQVTKIRVDATVNIFDTIPYQWSCGYTTPHGNSVVGCALDLRLEKKDGNRTVVEEIKD